MSKFAGPHCRSHRALSLSLSLSLSLCSIPLRLLQRADRESRLAADRAAELHQTLSPSSQWLCPSCTYANAASAPACDMCACARVGGGVRSQETQLYFEVTIVQRGGGGGGGDRGRIGVGLACADYSPDRMPGWDACSYAYHGDEGCLFGAGIQGAGYGPPFGAGDTIGVGYLPFRRQLFFTKNGVYLGVAFDDVPPLDFHAAVGCHSNGDEVVINTGQEPFAFKDTSERLILRPDVHWGPAVPGGFQVQRLVHARWCSSACGSILSQAALMAGGRPAPVHSADMDYFEVTVGVETAHEGGSAGPPPSASTALLQPIAISIGLALADCDLASVGGGASGYAYDGASGCVLHASNSRVFGRALSVGDVIGCGLDRDKQEIFFTLNSTHLGVAFTCVPDLPFHATVCLQGGHAAPAAAAATTTVALAVNFGSQPFRYGPGRRPTSSLRSPPQQHNTLGRHSPCVTVSALTVRHVGQGPGGLVQSARPLLPLSAEQLALAEEEAAHSSSASPSPSLPASLFVVHVSRSFGPIEDEELASLLSRRAEKAVVDPAGSGSHSESLRSPLAIDAATFDMTQEERVTYASLGNWLEAQHSSQTRAQSQRAHTRNRAGQSV